MENKTIYFSYRNNIPYFVFNRWLRLNPKYKIDFSLDEDCRQFLNNEFNTNVRNYFNNLDRGAFKCDLWRLCKLFKNSGVYADVDLVPYIDLDTLGNNITFYSCKGCWGGIFQAFMAINNKNSPLLLGLLISFMHHRAELINCIGPTIEMENFLKYNLNIHCSQPLHTDSVYELKTVKIKIIIGSSENNTKSIDLLYFPNNINYKIILKDNNDDKFDFNISNNQLHIKRIDRDSGWDHHHEVDICLDADERIYLFREHNTNHINNNFVTFKNNKILDSRDKNYVHMQGWNYNCNLELLNKKFTWGPNHFIEFFENGEMNAFGTGKYKIENTFNDEFLIKINGDKCIITRMDTNTGWSINLNIYTKIINNYYLLDIGNSQSNNKEIILDEKYDFVDDEYNISKNNWYNNDSCSDQFKVIINNGKCIINRIDHNTGWGIQLKIYVKIKNFGLIGNNHTKFDSENNKYKLNIGSSNTNTKEITIEPTLFDKNEFYVSKNNWAHLNYSVEANFGNEKHTIIFDKYYTDFISRRERDGDIIKGHYIL